MAVGCVHRDQIRFIDADKHYCAECIETDDYWVHLRMCLSCGHVGCCDSSPNQHATRHFLRTRHPLIRSIEPGETWMWCYVDGLELGQLQR